MNYSYFDKPLQTKDYLPDSIYTLCVNDKDNCNVCSNNTFSNLLDGYVHDVQRAKVFCPFGKDESMNKSNYSDQKFINDTTNTPITTWGRVPQLNPRPLSKIGLEWRSS